MNQPNDCPRFVSEVEHERAVGELSRRVEALVAGEAHWKAAARSESGRVAYQRKMLETCNATIAEQTKDVKDSSDATIEFGVAAIELKRDLEDRDQRIKELIAQVQTLRASAIVTTAAYDDWKMEAAAKLAQSKSWGDTLRAELAIAVNTRDHLTNELWRAKKERDGFEKAWNLACRERAEFERERNDARDGRYALSVSCDKARATNSTVLEDRARLQAELDQATKQRREFEAAWDQARVERDTFEKEYTGAIDQNTHLRKLFVTMHELLKQGGAA
ncbi:MAG: hypothetical protein RL260_2794 [Pseudomonadota bacterium]